MALAGCMTVSWHNPANPGRDFTADRNFCESQKASRLGVTHCMRSLGWDGEP